MIQPPFRAPQAPLSVDENMIDLEFGAQRERCWVYDNNNNDHAEHREGAP